MSDGDAARNGEPETGASRLARACLVHPVEALAQVRQMLGSNADPGVAHLQQGLSLLYCCTYNDTAPASIVFDGVVEQRQYSLFEQCGIADHHCCLMGFCLNTDLRLVG